MKASFDILRIVTRVTMTAFLVVIGNPIRSEAAQLYFDRAAFVASVSSAVVIDFETAPLGPVVGNPWLSQGIIFGQAGVGNNMSIGDGGGANRNISALGGEQADIEITLSGPVQAFGLGIFSNDRHTTAERIIFFASDNSIVADVEMPLTSLQGISFIGFLADAPLVSRVAFVEDADGDYAGIGDVVFTPVPEPNSATFLFASAGALICSRMFRTHDRRFRRPTRRCSEPGHRAPVAIGASCGPGR
jgi:hypothetical protein